MENEKEEPAIEKAVELTTGKTEGRAKSNRRGTRLAKRDLSTSPTLFKKGNPIGLRFGQGQPTHLGGRPPGAGSIVKQALKLYEDNALIAAQHLVEKGLDKFMDPKAQFPWFKELNSRILGAAKGSAEDIIYQLSEKIDSALSLTKPALEATAIGDAEGLIRELLKQGVLDKVIEKVKGESASE